MKEIEYLGERDPRSTLGLQPRFFQLVRNEDESGVSGTGPVAECCQFSDGRTVVAWVGSEQTGVHSIVVYESLRDAVRIHGHNGKTIFVEKPLLLNHQAPKPPSTPPAIIDGRNAEGG